jgi:hypothetical protein
LNILHQIALALRIIDTKWALHWIQLKKFLFKIRPTLQINYFENKSTNRNDSLREVIENWSLFFKLITKNLWICEHLLTYFNVYICWLIQYNITLLY